MQDYQSSGAPFVALVEAETAMIPGGYLVGSTVFATTTVTFPDGAVCEQGQELKVVGSSSQYPGYPVVVEHMGKQYSVDLSMISSGKKGHVRKTKDCNNQIVQGGRTHGERCKAEGCNNQVSKGGYCKAHGER